MLGQRARAATEAAKAAAHAVSLAGRSAPGRFLANIAWYARQSASAAIPAAVFSLTFLQWWFASEDQGSAGRASDGLAALPPPPPPAPREQGINGSGCCALCAAPRVNPAVLGASGYVFCFRCVHDHVARHETCPVSGVPAALAQIVRLHINED